MVNAIYTIFDEQYQEYRGFEIYERPKGGYCVYAWFSPVSIRIAYKKLKKRISYRRRFMYEVLWMRWVVGNQKAAKEFNSYREALSFGREVCGFEGFNYYLVYDIKRKIKYDLN
jgi:hypothetical protein